MGFCGAWFPLLNLANIVPALFTLACGVLNVWNGWKFEKKNLLVLNISNKSLKFLYLDEMEKWRGVIFAVTFHFVCLSTPIHLKLFKILITIQRSLICCVTPFLDMTTIFWFGELFLWALILLFTEFLVVVKSSQKWVWVISRLST